MLQCDIPVITTFLEFLET